MFVFSVKFIGAHGLSAECPPTAGLRCACLRMRWYIRIKNPFPAGSREALSGSSGRGTDSAQRRLYVRNLSIGKFHLCRAALRICGISNTGLVFCNFPPPRSSQKGVFIHCGCTKRKCGADFVYLQRGSDKTLNRINDALPHTCIDKMPQLRRLPVGWVVSKQENECCSLSRFTLKLSDFFVRTE